MNEQTSIYEQYLDKSGANYGSLTPLSFLERSGRGVSREDRCHSW